MEAWSEDIEARRVAATVRERLFGREAEPIEVDRFRLRARIGTGTSGVVYRAFDPRLEREIALKLVAPNADDEDRERLLAEGRALAKLEHPNVVAVYEVGEHSGRVFLAMGLVDGVNLRDWCEAETPSTEAIVDVFIDAANGLAAAHAEGLVHRDVKPDNVVIDAEGAVRVVDFGLAAPTAEAIESSGTPAYMAPEQWQSGACDARSDQFGFCVALYEAVVKKRPFEADNVEGLEATIIEGRFDDAAVPGWLRHVIARGLSVSPEDRFGSMDEIVVALSREDTKRRRRTLLSVGGVLVAASIAAIGTLVASRGPVCTDGADRLEGIWDEQTQGRLWRAVSSSSVAFAAIAAARSRESIDAYAMRWSAAYREACEATHVRHERTERTLEATMRCLEQRRGSIAATVETLAAIDTDGLARIDDVIAELESPQACAEPAAQTDPLQYEPMRKVERTVASARAQLSAGRSEQAAATIDGAMAAVELLDHRPTKARALWVRARVRHIRGAYEEATNDALESLRIATANAEKRQAARSAISAAETLSFGRSENVEALRWLDLAEAFTGERPDPATAAQLFSIRGEALKNLGRTEEALAAQKRALELTESAYGTEHPRYATALSRLALAHHLAGESSRALHEQAFGIRQRVLGPGHPDLADSHTRLGNVERRDENYEAAEAHFRAALEIRETHFGPNHREVAQTCFNFGWLQMLRRKLDDAEILYGRAMKGYAAAGNRRREGNALAMLGAVSLRAHKPRVALDRFEQAAAIYRETIDAKHHSWLVLRIERANALRALGDARRAKSQLERSLEMVPEKSNESSLRAVILGALGLAHQELGEADLAVENLEAALVLSEAKAPSQAWGLRFALARALYPSSNARALQLARTSREHYASMGDRGRLMVAEIDAWLARPALDSRVSPVHGADALGAFGPFW